MRKNLKLRLVLEGTAMNISLIFSKSSVAKHNTHTHTHEY